MLTDCTRNATDDLRALYHRVATDFRAEQQNMASELANYMDQGLPRWYPTKARLDELHKTVAGIQVQLFSAQKSAEEQTQTSRNLTNDEEKFRMWAQLVVCRMLEVIVLVSYIFLFRHCSF